jgi:hypothetical protein
MKRLKALFSNRAKVKAFDMSRIPEPLREIVGRGRYLRANPYPVDRIIEAFKSEKIATRESAIIAMGSCFAQELYRWLIKNGYNCLPHEWGVIYSPQSFAQIIQYSLEPESWQPEEPFWLIDGKYYDPYVKAIKPIGPTLRGDDLPGAEAAQHLHRAQSAELLLQADLAVWTLGLTELWRNKRDHKAYYAIPYPQVYDPARHEFYSLTYEEVIQQLTYAIETLVKHNPSISVLLSVSPVPLSVSYREEYGPYIATQVSKSILHAAAFALVEKYDHVFYMPSYEIARNDPRANYRADGRHVNQHCVDTVMEAFKHLYVGD